MRTLMVFAALALPACAMSPADVGNDGAGDGDQAPAATTLSPSDTAAVLALVNYPGTTQQILDVSAGLDSRAATNIISHRNGADGISPSADDAPFTTLASLEAIPYVGASAITKLRTYALAHPAPAGETVKGVVFSGYESNGIVWGVNQATIEELDGMLDNRAAAGLIAKRPFTSVAQMGTVSYVATTALTVLRNKSAFWWTAEQNPFIVNDDILGAWTGDMRDDLWDNDTFVATVNTLANNDQDLVNTIMAALGTQILTLTHPLYNEAFESSTIAEQAVHDAAPVEQWTTTGGWTYLNSIGVTQP